MKRRNWQLAMLVVALLASRATAQLTHNPTDMLLTKHNLSVSGTGNIRAVSETRICVFCHTPHNAAPLSPLWNKELQPRNYVTYASPTLQAGPLPQPSGPTKLCLSCHDGMIAMGGVLNPAGGIAMAGGDFLPQGSLSNFGFDLSGHHPVSFPYQNALPNTELAPTPPLDLVFGGGDELHCTTCHDPHNDSFGKFLLKDNRFSALCTTCHQIDGWTGSLHATSSASVVGVLPRPPKTYPAYTQLNEWGCEACHTPHFAPTAEGLLNFTDTPPAFSCTTASACHGSSPGAPHRARSGADGGVRVEMPDIERQIRKPSAHRAAAGQTRALSLVEARTAVRGATCADCHPPHQVNDLEAEPPFASGMLRGASGVDRNGGEVRRATYEYEVCFKCHAENNPGIDYVPRAVASTNLRLAFDSANPSFHPVVAMGRNLDIPSIPSALEPTLSPAQQIYCSTCHADDEGGARGPHGSAFPPILRERYLTGDNIAESYESYALCYRCHERDSILRDDSFRPKTVRTTGSGGGHSGHLAAGAPCSACHDPHGVNDVSIGTSSPTGSHTHLINFDTRIVLPKSGEPYPRFDDTGTFSGSCTLTCHGVSHDHWSYP